MGYSLCVCVNFLCVPRHDARIMGKYKKPSLSLKLCIPFIFIAVWYSTRIILVIWLLIHMMNSELMKCYDFRTKVIYIHVLTEILLFYWADRSADKAQVANSQLMNDFIANRWMTLCSTLTVLTVSGVSTSMLRPVTDGYVFWVI